MTPPASMLASHDVNGVINDTNALKLPFHSSNAISTGSGFTWCSWYHWYHHCIPLVKMIKKVCNIMSWSYDTICPGLSVLWCRQNHQWHHCITYVKSIEMTYNVTFLVMWCHCHLHHVMQMPSLQFNLWGYAYWNEVQHDLIGHEQPLTSHNAFGIVNCSL